MSDGASTKPMIDTSSIARRNRKSSVDNVSHNLRKFISKIPHPISPPLTSPRSSISHKLELGEDADMDEEVIKHRWNGTATLGRASVISKELPPSSPSQEQIDLIRVSWEKVSKLKHDTDDPTLSPANAFGREFFNALYDMDIECKGAFGNAFQQARALSGMIMYIVRAPSLSMSTKKCGRDGARRGQTPSLCKSQSTFGHPTPTSSRSKSSEDQEDELSALPFEGNKGQHLDEARPITTIREINAARKRANSDSVQPRNTIASSPIDYKEMDPAQLILLMKDTGARHYFYPHVKPHFFDLVGPAFVIALKKRLKEEYTEAMGEAWVEANAYIAYYLKIGFNTQQAWEEQQQQQSLNTNTQFPGTNRGDCTIQ